MQKDFNILIGMAGAGKRFQSLDQNLPKYLMVYHGSTMIYHSVKTIKIPGIIHFVVLEDHLRRFRYLESLLLSLGHVIIPIKEVTQGAAQSLLMARDHIKDPSLPMLSVNCDQYMKWNPTDFLDTIKQEPTTSFIPVVNSLRPDFSYVREQAGYVVEVREKKRISLTATMGYYHWAKTSDFFIDAAAMIEADVKDNNEFYMAPVYNFTIRRNLKVKTFGLGEHKYFPVGIPSELIQFSSTDNGFD